LSHFLKNAKRNNLVLKSQEAQASAQSFAKQRAVAAYYPSLELEGSRLHDLPLTDREKTRASDSFQLSLGVIQNIYDEKLPRTFERESAKGNKAKAQLEDVTERLLHETGLAFFTLAQYQSEAALKMQQLQVQLEEELILQRRIKLGELSLTNASQIRAQIERSRANLMLLKSKISEQRLNLSRLCLCIVPASLQLPSEDLWPKALEMKNGASSPLLSLPKAEVEVAQAELRLIQSNRSPTLSLEGLVYRDFMVDSPSLRSSVALNLTWPLDVAHVNRHERSQASSQLQSARFNLQAQQNDLQSSQQMARERLLTLLESRKFFEAALRSAQQHFEHTKRQFAEGANTQSELFLAQSDLFQAESDLLGHTFESWLAYWNLIFYHDSVTRIMEEAEEGA
jgi:outer membrane protein TolC